MKLVFNTSVCDTRNGMGRGVRDTSVIGINKRVERRFGAVRGREKCKRDS